jgi:hypothetical protein
MRIFWLAIREIVLLRKVAFVAPSLFLCLSCPVQACHNPVKAAVESQRSNYTITINPPIEALSLKSPLLVGMYYTNAANSDIYMVALMCKICAAERISLTKDGREVDTTPLQRARTGRGTTSDNFRITGCFQPGIFWIHHLDLRTLYNITEAGNYKLIASRTEKSKDGVVEVKSNEVDLDIAP